MKTIVGVGAVAIAVFSWGGVQIVDFRQDEGTRTVTATYNLTGADAIVTCDIQTNITGTADYASIGGENQSYMVGDVNRVVEAGSNRKISWQPLKAWPNMNHPALRAVITAWDLANPPDVMVIDLTIKSNITYYADMSFLPGGVTSTVYKTEKLVMRKIPAGGRSFMMGSPDGEAGRNWNVDYRVQETQHQVSFANDFYMGVYVVTRRQHELVTGSATDYSAKMHDGLQLGADGTNCLPQVRVSYSGLRGTTSGILYPLEGNAVQAGSTLGTFSAFTGLPFDLPTSAEWEYACRAGTTTALNNGSNITSITWHNQKPCPEVDEIAWYQYNCGMTSSSDSTWWVHPVGMKKCNAWGLYDMSGNVAEWCLDLWNTNAVTTAQLDPVGASETSTGQTPVSGSTDAVKNISRVIRGGAFSNLSPQIRSAFFGKQGQGWSEWHIGYRLKCRIGN